MPRRTAVDWYSVEAAAGPNLILTRHELHALGVTQSMIWVRVRDGGPWSRVLPGVIMLRNGTPTAKQRLDAALRYAGDGAMLTGLTGARLHGLTQAPQPDRIHVLVPEQRQPASHSFVLIERTTRLPRVVKRDGFPAAEVTRAVLDGARRLTRHREVEALLAHAVQTGRTTPRHLRAELEAGSDRGSALPRAALQAVTLGARSAAEADATRLAHRAKLPEPKWNVPLRTTSGLILPTPDGWFDEVALAWEIDSLEWHLSPEGYDATLRRHAIMTGAGIIVVHTLPSRLRTEPQAVISELRDAYQQAAQRPRPAIITG